MQLAHAGPKSQSLAARDLCFPANATFPVTDDQRREIEGHGEGRPAYGHDAGREREPTAGISEARVRHKSRAT